MTLRRGTSRTPVGYRCRVTHRIAALALLALAPLTLDPASLAPLADAQTVPLHATIDSTVPADGEVLSAPVPQFQVTANEALVTLGEGDANAMTVQLVGGDFYGDGCTSVDGATLSMGATFGIPGTYMITYQVVSADGHTVSGQTTFEWRPDADVPLVEGSPEPPVCGDPATDPVSMPIQTTDPTQSSEEPVVVTVTPTPVASEPAAETESTGGDWVFIVVAIVAVLLVIAVMVWTYLRARRPRDEAPVDEPHDDAE